ncbi:MAG TPA: Hpt domain-containing protein [Candidatus Thermoplasmatota archaeon]|nr:Hpt domain-containing protein [Candidatus Thermoplasmatota archaeon]
MSPAVDEGVLRGLLDDMGGDVEVVKELIQSYLGEAPRLLAEARQATAARDAGTLQRAAHTLKSTSATFGAMELSEASKALEHAAKDGAVPEASRLDGLEAMFAAVRAELVKRL